MSSDPFVHLHVASGFSLRYGASHPHVLVQRAAEHGMDTLALTDRDGTYGAVKFVGAARRAGIRPVLGVDLAVAPTTDAATGGAATGGGGRPPRRRTPARGGVSRDPSPQQGGGARVTFLAMGGAGWAALCRMVSSVHLSGERGRPVATLDLLAPHLAGGDVLVLLGPSSELGAVATRRRDDLGPTVLAPWLEVVPRPNLVVELVSHRLGGRGGAWGPGTSAHAARMAGLARRAGLTTVLTNAVRYTDRLDAPTVDVLDAARRLVPLGSAGLRDVGPDGARGNAEGFLKTGKQMHEVADEVCRLAGLGDSEQEARRLLARTRAVADRCALDPRTDLGIGEVHFPELELPDAGPHRTADALLRARCEAAIGWRYGTGPRMRVWKRLDDELETIRTLGYASYFLTVADVTDLIGEMGVRRAARGSGAGSLVNYLLGISGVDPIRHGLLMERFLSPLRASLPDIDVDVESARREEVYRAILDRFGGERCVTVSMMDTYRVRHAVRDVGAALGMPPGEVDAIAKAFPHVRARDARSALRDLPELRASGLGDGALDRFFGLVERLDGLPRHIAMHPCGVLLSDVTLLDRTPVEASHAGFPMSQFDKDDVEELGLLKLDVLGIRMQSAMAHAVAEVRRVDGVHVDLDDEAQVPFDDATTYDLISSAKTLGVFQIESPGQRELVGKSGIETFDDIITDISLFRPGPVKSDMITPYLEAKHGWRDVHYLHDDLRPILEGTRGVVVFHEQVIEIIARFGGVSYAEADEKRRALGSSDGMAATRTWFLPRALAQGYDLGAGRAHLDGPRGVRLVRLLQGPRRRVRPADLPVGVAQGPLAGALPRRGADPRPGHVPQAPDPRRRPPGRGRRAGARRQRQRIGLRRGARRRRRRRVPEPRDPALPHRRQGHQRRRGGPHRRGARGRPLRVAVRLLPPSPGLPADPRAAGAGRRVRRGLRHRDGRAGPRPARSDHAARPAAAGRRARPPCASGRPGLADARSRPDQAQCAVDGGHCCDGRCCPQQHRSHGAGRVGVDGAARAGRGGRLGARLGAVEGDAAGGRGRVGPAHAGAG